ncbi:LasU family protein [Lactiplantibacillus plantarum]|uniref:LasU family protein n=1 Tax=Lactiplantibacillus plantarum TaxID=1590 RepID=UPI003F52FAFF
MKLILGGVMRMKRRLIAAPTGLLLAGWLISWGLQAMHQPMGTAWTAYAFTLLILYTILATFITSMADAYQGKHGRTVPEKQFYWYMCTLSVILTILAIYWMAHN